MIKNEKPFYIRDPVSGDIQIDEATQNIIEKPEFQRLRRIKQLGFAYLVFPGAHHTRFEHSIGTYNVTRDISKRVMQDEDPELCIAGLLHDVGHMPMSHESEAPMYKYIKTLHEGLGRKMIAKGQLLDDIGDFGLSKKKIISYFDGIAEGKMVTGPIGTDRLDYLLRDAYYTGVAYGIIDYQRLRNVITLYKNEPAAYETGIDAIESFFIARYYMYSSVYFHHAVVIANSMYKKALALALGSGNIDPNEFAGSTDDEAVAKLLEIKASSGLMKSVLERKLFKRAYYNPNFTEGITEKELNDIISGAGIGENEYIAQVYKFKGKEDNIKILSKSMKEVNSLSGVSGIFEMLTEVLEKRKIVLVACKQQHVAKLGRAIEKAL